MGDKKPKAYTFTKNVGPQFNLLPDAEPMDYFILFFNDELLNNIVVESKRYARHKIAELQLIPWSDVSVPEVKSFLDLIINMGLIPLPNIKDYWSSERKTEIIFFCDVMSRDRFLQTIWMMQVGEMTPPKKIIRPSKEQRKYMG
jgi:hypothetical protein